MYYMPKFNSGNKLYIPRERWRSRTSRTIAVKVIYLKKKSNLGSPTYVKPFFICSNNIKRDLEAFAKFNIKSYWKVAMKIPTGIFRGVP